MENYEREIISVGTELLLGQIVNTNASFISQRLAELGIDVYYTTTVEIMQPVYGGLCQGWQRSDLIILTGGLGPTMDDLTRRLSPVFRAGIGAGPWSFKHFAELFCQSGPDDD